MFNQLTHTPLVDMGYIVSFYMCVHSIAYSMQTKKAVACQIYRYSL